MKSKNKAELISQIQKIDLLEFISQQIQKKSTTAIKKAILSKFTQDAAAYAADERDVLLIAVKIR